MESSQTHCEPNHPPPAQPGFRGQLLAAIDWLLPPGLRTAEPELRFRARILMVGLVIMTVPAVLFLCVSVVSAKRPVPPLLLVRIASLVAIWGFFRGTGSLVLGANLLVAATYTHLVWAAIELNAVLPMLGFFVAPLVALLLAGRTSGLMWLLVSLATMLYLGRSLGLLDRLGNPDLGPGHTIVTIVGPVVVASVLFAVAWTYDVLKRRAFTELAQRTEQAIVSERKSLQAEHERAQAQARAQLIESSRLASLGTLAAGVAHEINNPLAFVLVNLQCLAETLGPLKRTLQPEQQQEFTDLVTDMDDGLQRIRNIVGDLRTFSRAEDEDVGEPVDIRAVMDAALNLCHNQIRHRATVVQDYQEVPMVVANESRLAQIFINLLINAAQALPERQSADQQIRVTTGIDDRGHVFAAVSDTGHGIPKDILPRLFDPFFTTKPQGEGTGLGLSICHGIVADMGGEITVDSEVGKGTTFRVVLPVVDARVAPTRDKVAAAGDEAPARARILVIDDEVAIAQSLARLLHEHDVQLATTGLAAIERLDRGDDFDVVLCDVMMPEVNGIDLYGHVLEHHPKIAKRFVFMTGGTFTEQMRAYLQELPVPCLEKPLQIAELRAEICRLVGPARTRAVG